MLCFALASCSHDNYDEPDSVLTGTITYNGAAVGVRGGENQLEIWQDGYALSSKVAVYIAQDGTFSASLFAGEYKVVRLSGAPWSNQSSDTIVVKVSGATNLDVPVTPYFTIDNVSQTYFGNELSVTFTVNKVVSDAELANVYLYLGENLLTNNINNDMAVKVDLASVTLGQPITVKTAISADLASLNFIYTRVGVNSNKSSRYVLSQSEKVTF